MKQEDKQLLLKDPSARLLYELIVNAQYKDGEGWKTEDRKILGIYEDGQVYLDCVYTTIDCIKPYLLPMSSMTEEENKEFAKVMVESQDCSYQNNESVTTMVNDWYLSKGFDVRGLIPKGLVLEALEGMYNL
jgi:hypothetical protein